MPQRGAGRTRARRITRAARERSAELGYAAGWSLVRAAPDALSRRAFDLGADLAVRRDGAGVRRLRANLTRVVRSSAHADAHAQADAAVASEADLDALVAAGVRSYARYWRETFRLSRMDHAAVVADVDAGCEGREHLVAALAAGRGAIVALPHMGNWDVAGLWLVAEHGPFTTVVERLQPESLFDRFLAYRESLGFEIVPLTGGERSALEVLRERLRANGVVCLVGDRDLSHSGVPVTLFGAATRLPGGPALLAATTGAALLPCGTWFTERGWGQRINAPLAVPDGRLREQVPALSQALADAFAAEIADHPSDWHMLQPLWLADLPARG